MKKYLLCISILLLVGCNKNVTKILMPDFVGKDITAVEEFSNSNGFVITTKEEYSNYKKGTVLEQSIKEGSELGDMEVTISKGLDYATLKVNELGDVPIMMYHGIHNITDNKYTGGNVDYDGYQRTADAFRGDLEFYYTSGYRMVRLIDYVNGIIDVEAGLSPLVITFDDGLVNAIKVTGLDEDGEIIIDPNSAVGILESFKKKYPDYNVTATFFVNGGLFRQYSYNEKILNWLVDHGYDIGNHSYSHADFTTISKEESVQEIGSMYNLLDKYIPGKYVNIVAMPYGSPYRKTHDNFPALLKGNYNGKYYETISTLMVGWEAEVSPFSKSFDREMLKRIRAYDNNGKEFDIEMNFKRLKNNRYISDGDKDTVTVPKSKKDRLNDTTLEIVTY